MTPIVYRIKLFYVKFIACTCIFAALQLCSENDGEYLCKDGQCIGLMSRCDEIRDCSKGEDEQNCSKLNRFYEIQYSGLFESHL